MLYHPGNQVFYCSHGVCEILDIEQRRIDKKNIEYYVLSPVCNPNARFYIPTSNPKVVSKLSPLLTAEELQIFLAELCDSRDLWIDEENLRKQKLKDVIASGKQTDLIQWVRALHMHKRALLDQGKKFHMADESFLKDAEKILIAEFSIIWKIPKESVIQQVHNTVSTKKGCCK